MKTRLKIGDLVLLKATDIFDGKVGTLVEFYDNNISCSVNVFLERMGRFDNYGFFLYEVEYWELNEYLVKK